MTFQCGTVSTAFLQSCADTTEIIQYLYLNFHWDSLWTTYLQARELGSEHWQHSPFRFDFPPDSCVTSRLRVRGQACQPLHVFCFADKTHCPVPSCSFTSDTKISHFFTSSSIHSVMLWIPFKNLHLYPATEVLLCLLLLLPPLPLCQLQLCCFGACCSASPKGRLRSLHR